LQDAERKKWARFFLSNHAQFPHGILRVLAEMRNTFLHLPTELNPPKPQFIDFGNFIALLLVAFSNISSYCMADSFRLI
jgi:hypothetical protein